MRRRPLTALVPLAMLAVVAQSGSASVPPLTSIVTAGSSSWGARVPCEFTATKGSAFDMKQVLLEGSSGAPLTFTFTLRTLPKVTQAATASITFRKARSTRAGILLVRWPGGGEGPVVSEFDRTTNRRTVLATRPVVDRGAKTITVSFPTDVFGFGDGFWYWNADTYVEGKHVDNCTAHRRSLQHTAVDAALLR